jgi:hypothetical protein
MHTYLQSYLNPLLSNIKKDITPQELKDLILIENEKINSEFYEEQK